MAPANLGIPSTAPFDAKEEPTSVAQRWEKWLKQFQYFEDASRINNNSKKKALLLHLAGTETQDIYIQDIYPTNATYEASLEALNTHFPVTKNIPYETFLKIQIEPS